MLQVHKALQVWMVQTELTAWMGLQVQRVLLVFQAHKVLQVWMVLMVQTVWTVLMVQTV